MIKKDGESMEATKKTILGTQVPPLLMIISQHKPLIRKCKSNPRKKGCHVVPSTGVQTYIFGLPEL